jgi:hypothetical protein
MKNIIIIILIVIYIYFMQFKYPKYEKIDLSNLLLNTKTGDLILFHACDNFHAPLIMSYMTHVGIVYRNNNNSKPLLFEAMMPNNTFPTKFKNGILLVDLEERCKTYKGFMYYKELAIPISSISNDEFYIFIKWALYNLYYMNNLFTNAIQKVILNDNFRYSTQCGELTTLSLIKLNLLSKFEFNNNRKHHLKWICNLTNLNNNYYLPLKEIFIQQYIS